MFSNSALLDHITKGNLEDGARGGVDTVIPRLVFADYNGRFTKNEISKKVMVSFN